MHTPEAASSLQIDSSVMLSHIARGPHTPSALTAHALFNVHSLGESALQSTEVYVVQVNGVFVTVQSRVGQFVAGNAEHSRSFTHWSLLVCVKMHFFLFARHCSAVSPLQTAGLS